MSRETKQPKNYKAKKLNKLATKARTNKSKKHELIKKLRRLAAVKRFNGYMWFFKHGKKEDAENND